MRELSSVESLGCSGSIPVKCDGIASKEYLKPCGRLTYHPRRLKSKGAILIVIWNFLLMTAFHYMRTTITSVHGFTVITVPTVVGMMLPIAGLLAC